MCGLCVNKTYCADDKVTVWTHSLSAALRPITQRTWIVTLMQAAAACESSALCSCLFIDCVCAANSPVLLHLKADKGLKVRVGPPQSLYGFLYGFKVE